jgi:hypothetical protein
MELKRTSRNSAAGMEKLLKVPKKWILLCCNEFAVLSDGEWLYVSAFKLLSL